MSKSLKRISAALLLCAANLGNAQTADKLADKFTDIGRAATPKEVAAWDIDVRPDFKGLPKGAGSVAQGQDIWEAKCASCHGVFGEANNVFNPLVGGTTADDVKTGRVARLTEVGYPQRTTLMKLATLSTLWDYIYRAMPWTQPKSLTPDEVYAVTAFMLNLGAVLPNEFTLSDKNVAEVQARMPNRLGMTTAHALWPGSELGGKAGADVQAKACMANCGDAPKITSSLPDFARNAHGNLANQNRWVGAQRGAQTEAVAVAAVDAKSGSDANPALALISKHSCTACHGMAQKLVGPSFNDISAKQAGRVDYLIGKIKAGGTGVWGAIPMPAQSLPDADVKVIASWLSAPASAGASR
jgi:S-disulfanyl-L-cysteine oxidoreductase SoxD